jgi:hypothetical protein
MRTQDQWRWCNRCYALFYAGFGGGGCAGGAGHDPSGSTAYHAPIDEVPDGAQPGWHWCGRCQSLVYADGDGPCFSSDRHDATGSSEYAVPLERDASRAAGTIAGQTVKATATALGAPRIAAWATGKVAGLGTGAVLDLLIPSTSLAKETFIESSLLDGTPIHYVILDHQ